jgi:hypothetical protein
MVAKKAAKLAAKEVSMHVSPTKKRRRKKLWLILIAATMMSAADGKSYSMKRRTPEFSRHVGYHFLRTPLIFLVCLYIVVHVDSIVGPTVVISDISQDYAGNHNPALALGHPSCPYIFMSCQRNQSANDWMSFINWQYQKTVHNKVASQALLGRWRLTQHGRDDTCRCHHCVDHIIANDKVALGTP